MCSTVVMNLEFGCPYFFLIENQCSFWLYILNQKSKVFIMMCLKLFYFILSLFFFFRFFLLSRFLLGLFFFFFLFNSDGKAAPGLKGFPTVTDSEDFPPLCILLCRERTDLLLKVFQHSLHSKGFSPLWIQWCSDRVEIFLKDFPQSSHS